MGQEEKVQVVGYLISNSQITTFREIFNVFPKSQLAKHLGKNASRMDNLISDPARLRYEEIKAIAEYFCVMTCEIIALIDAHYTTTGKRKVFL